MKQLSGQDNSFLEIEKTGLPQHVSSVMIYDQSTAKGGKVKFKDILTHIKSRLHLSPLFQSKLHEVPLDVDRPYLIDDEQFDLEYHVRHIALPKPGDWRQLCILLARINARPLDLTRPLWEMYIIEGLDNIDHVPSGSFALLFRMHHCVMDGAVGAQMIAAIHDFSAKPSTPKVPSTRVIYTPKSSIELLGRAYLNALKKPKRIFNLGKQIARAQSNKHKLKSEDLPEPATRKVSTRFNQPISPHRVLDAITFDFSDLREIKNSVKGATINDVLLSIVSGALHKYLSLVDELPEETLICGCPIDIRKESDDAKSGNVLGFMGVALRNEIADPLERFIAVHEASKASKANAEVSDLRIPMEFNESVPAAVMNTVMRLTSAAGVSVTPYNTMLTNVPGPTNQLYLAGAQITDGFGIGPLVPGVGLFHTASSAVQNNQGKLNLSFWACREMLPDPDVYKQCIIDSFNELQEATA